MSDLPTIAESAASVIWYSKVNIAVSLVNIISAGLLIYGTLKLREGNRLLRDTAKRLREAAQGDRNDAP